MRNPASARSHPPVAEGTGVTIALAVVAYLLFVLAAGLTVERLIAATPPDILAGLTQGAVTGGLAP